MIKYGRPMKGASRRVPIAIHAPLQMVDVIDKYVEEQAKSTNTAYSRSDFYRDAAVEYLRTRGVEISDERTESVPKNYIAENSQS